ncbi:response regulator transcription factor [Bifidobacterium oedipodis]|uniref:DNA-binding response regulator n=1 Tax=Bifidobacterium oedipodis TaxID=2675322 RepID=A0A7Y0EQ62_9BIFI|nr:response regulator transcription factor [Bifidobacterium sp. DSM 109957]NMM94342.1 DNA-binding response regulator [Bifidobacterium sp. DSM 109957]
MNQATMVGIVDNDVFALQAIAAYLKRALPDSYSIAWLANSGGKALDFIRTEKHPDVMLVDMSMEDMEGSSLIRAVRERDNHIYIIAITSFSLQEYANEASAAGAQTIIGKSELKKLVNTIIQKDILQKTICGNVFQSPQKSFEALAQNTRNGIHSLSNREKSIIALCSQGDTSVEIANKLGLSESTINTYLKRAIAKTHARNRVHLVSMWMQSCLRHSN